MTTTFETLKTKQIEQRTKIQDRLGTRNPGADKLVTFGHESALELNAKWAFVNAQVCGQVLNKSMLVHSFGAKLKVVIDEGLHNPC